MWRTTISNLFFGLQVLCITAAQTTHDVCYMRTNSTAFATSPIRAMYRTNTTEECLNACTNEMQFTCYGVIAMPMKEGGHCYLYSDAALGANTTSKQIVDASLVKQFRRTDCSTRLATTTTTIGSNSAGFTSGTLTIASACCKRKIIHCLLLFFAIYWHR